MLVLLSRFMRSAMTLANNAADCGIVTPHWSLSPPSDTVTGEIAIIGTFNSFAIAIIAIVDGAVAVPMRMSTLFSSTSFRAFRVEADGSAPSSSSITVIFSPPTSL